MYLMIGAIVSAINAIFMIIEHKNLESIISKLYYYYPSEQKSLLDISNRRHCISNCVLFLVADCCIY